MAFGDCCADYVDVCTALVPAAAPAPAPAPLEVELPPGVSPPPGVSSPPPPADDGSGAPDATFAFVLATVIATTRILFERGWKPRAR